MVLLLLVLLPAAYVLWFMNEVVRSESATARQRVMEAYRGQLRLVRSRIDAHWRTQAGVLHGTGSPGLRFQQLIEGGKADGVLVLGSDGRAVYPDASPSIGRPAAMQSEVAEVEQLPDGPAREARIPGLASRLNDYGLPLPAPDRLMLMGRVRALAPNVHLPTQAALRTSIDVLEAGIPTPEPGRLQLTATREVWALASDDGQVIALYRTGRIESMMHDFLHQVTPAGIVFITIPPGEGDDPEAIAAGPALPGWQVTFQPLDLTLFDAAARRKALGYVSVAAIGIAFIGIMGVAVARNFRRHLNTARLKTDLVANVSHELRTPLAAMQVLVDGLMADEERNPAKWQEYLGLLAAEQDRLSRVVDHFLTFSRFERGRSQLNLASVQPSSIVAATLNVLRNRHPATPDIRVDVALDLPPVLGDSDALVTALVNLVDNALKYSPSEKRVVVRAYRDGDGAVAFAVSDNGIGIPAREQRRIFRRFYRIDQKLARSTGGVGLGLSIVELIVRAHRGTVEVRSEAGGGSTFTVRLPCEAGGIG
jgi:signal transduction histidine kinase